MADEIEFGKVEKIMTAKQIKNKMLYCPKDGTPIIVRFIGRQQKIYRRWYRNNYQKMVMSYHDTQIADTKPGYISFVIDRSDDSVKAFDCPPSAFRQLAEYGPTHDFRIHRTGQGLQTRYVVASMGETSVSDEIEDRVEITQNAYPLSDIFINKIDWELLEMEQEPIENRFDILDL